jgi:putative nucleotidyltransferase with HDIG domain
MQKILFVDDEKSILNLAREYFKRKGYSVLTAGNGKEAVDILKNESVDCCFTDINMPEMDGLELAEYIRNFDSTLPVVVMTGYPSLETTIQTLKNGVVDFLIKPVNLNQMELCVQRVFSQQRLFIENLLLKKEVEGTRRLEQLNRELGLKVEELNVLNRILQQFLVKVSSQDVFRRLVDTAVEVLACDDACFYLIDENVKQPFIISRAFAPPGPADTGTALPQQPEMEALDSLVLEIAADRLPLLFSGSTETPRLPAGIRSLAGVPLTIRNNVFGVLVATVSGDARTLTEKDLYYLSFMAQSAAGAIENLALYENIYHNLFATLYAFVNTIEARDRYTRQHSNRVTRYALIIGKALGCSSEELDVLNFAGHLHDIGKIGIRDDILLKPGKLSDAEFEKIKEHPVIGANILKQLGFWERERRIILHHHERYDGTGYPHGLKKDEIPLLARILSVADVYDALSSDRAYRRRMEESQVLNILREGAGTQFDPEMIAVFFKLHDNGQLRLEAGVDIGPYSEIQN